MKIENQKELAKLINLCRSKGVDSIEVDGIKLCLSKDAPVKANKKESSDAIETPDAITEEEALYWSAGGVN